MFKTVRKDDDNDKKMIKILIADRCSKKEAEKFANAPGGNPGNCTIYNNIEEYQNSIKMNGMVPETAEDLRAGKIADHSVVNYENHEYVIEYVL